MKSYTLEECAIVFQSTANQKKNLNIPTWMSEKAINIAKKMGRKVICGVANSEKTSFIVNKPFSKKG